jgi:hypothetical protein
MKHLPCALVGVVALSAATAYAQDPYTNGTRQAQEATARCYAKVKPGARPGVPEDFQEALRCLEDEMAKADEREKAAERRLWGTPSAPATPSRPAVQQPENWVRATPTGRDASTYPMIRCMYRTVNGYEFSITSREPSCPMSVEIHPESGRVRTL